MKSRPFCISIVSEDRRVLRRLSRFLGAFGFQVMPTADTRLAGAMQEFGLPDFLIIDGDEEALQKCQTLLSEASARGVYILQLASELTSPELIQSLKMGVNDFLVKPIVFGELLARVRAGARFLEYERRVREQSTICSITSLLNAAAFRERLGHELAVSLGDDTLHCILIEIDLFGQFRQTAGRTAADTLLRTYADCLRSAAHSAKYLASFGSGRFAGMVVEPSEARVLAWAETVREGIAAIRCPAVEGTDLFTASIGVAGCRADEGSVSQLLERAGKALRFAMESGGNCVVRCGQFDEETRSWETLAREGRLFENTTARDVMVPCPCVVPQEMDARRATQLLIQTGLQDLPVVDWQGTIVGLMRGEVLDQDRSRRSGAQAVVGDVMTAGLPIVDEDTPFQALMGHFMNEAAACDVVAVARRKQPIGLVYRSGLAALSTSLNTASFQPTAEFSTGTGYLAVPDLCETTG